MSLSANAEVKQAGPQIAAGFLLHTAHTEEAAMTVENLITIVDRIALSLINTLVVVGLPLITVGLLTQAL